MCVLQALTQRRCRYSQAQAQLDKVQGKAGSYEHMSGVVKDQNETLAKELSALHRQVSCIRGSGFDFVSGAAAAARR